MNQYDNNSIALVGMSGCGKSYWSEKLAQNLGYSLYVVDYLIEKELDKEIKNSGFDDITSWMGKPSDQNFEERQQQYFNLEKLYIEEISSRIQDKNYVVDTTGSFIHLTKETIESLIDKVLVIHLQTPSNSYSEMFHEFQSNPKPIVWGDNYQNSISLEENYINLLNFRKKCYHETSDISIPYETHRSKDFTIKELIKLIEENEIL